MIDILADLSGPRLFLRRLDSVVEEGASVIVSTRTGTEQELATLVISSLRSFGRSAAQADPSIEDPLTALLDAAGSAGGNTTLDRLTESCSSGECLVAQCRDAGDCSRWSPFALRLHHRLRQQPTRTRLRLILVCCDALARQVAQPDVALEHLDWDRALAHADIVSFANAQLPTRHSHPILRAVLVETLARVAGAELDLLLELSHSTAPEICRPFESLRRWGSRDAWRYRSPESLELLRGHPVSLAISGDRRSLDSICWRAQLTVLLPWVEDQRQRLLPALTGLLRRGPLSGTNIEDLEVGSLHYELQQSSPHSRIACAIAGLRFLRNCLAHRTPLRFDEIEKEVRRVELVET